MSSLCPRSVFGIRGHCVLFHSVRSAFTDHDVGSSLPDCKILTTHLTITFVGKCIIYMKFYYQDTIMVVSRQTPGRSECRFFPIHLPFVYVKRQRTAKKTANERQMKQHKNNKRCSKERQMKRQKNGKRSDDERQTTRQMKQQTKRRRTANDAANEAATNGKRRSK